MLRVPELVDLQPANFLAGLYRDRENTSGRPKAPRLGGTHTSKCRVTQCDLCSEPLTQPGKPVRLPQKRYTTRTDEDKKIRPVEEVGKADPVSIGSAGCTDGSSVHAERSSRSSRATRSGVLDGKAVVPLVVEHTCSTPWSIRPRDTPGGVVVNSSLYSVE